MNPAVVNYFLDVWPLSVMNFHDFRGHNENCHLVKGLVLKGYRKKQSFSKNLSEFKKFAHDATSYPWHTRCVVKKACQAEADECSFLLFKGNNLMNFGKCYIRQLN